MFKHTYTHTNANANAFIYKWMKFVERKAKCDVLCKEHKLLIIMTYQHKVETSFQSFQTNLFWWWKIYFFFEVREKIDAVNKNIFFFSLLICSMEWCISIFTWTKVGEHLSKVTFVNGIIIWCTMKCMYVKWHNAETIYNQKTTTFFNLKFGWRISHGLMHRSITVK